MAVTRPRRRRQQKWRRISKRLPWLAAGLGALTARDLRGQSSADARFLFYQESGGRTQVLDPVILWRQDLGESNGAFNLLLGYDAISGASPTGAYPTSDVTTSASGHLINAGSIPQTNYTDARKSASLSYERKFGAHLPSIDVSYAKENDYVARSAGISDSWVMAGGRGTLHLGVSFSRDFVEPVKNTVTNPEGLNLQYDKKEDGYSLGWTWVLGERDLLDVSASLMRLSGYLDDPYKVVPIGADAATTVGEHRPDTRDRRALVAKYGHHYPWDGALRIIYRFYDDSWGIQAHTLEAAYDHRLFDDWIVTPQIRFYTQTGASFYGSHFPTPQQYMSADYRLSPLDSFLFGLSVSYKLENGLSLSLGGTYQVQTGRDQVLPTQTSPPPPGVPPAKRISAADMNVLAITAGVHKTF